MPNTNTHAYGRRTLMQLATICRLLQLERIGVCTLAPAYKARLRADLDELLASGLVA